MRVPFDNADLSELVEIWNGFFPPKYAIDVEQFKLHTVDSPVFDWGASYVELAGGRPVGFVAIKRSANPTLYSGPDPDQAHICALAFVDPEVGVDLLALSKSILRSRGTFKLVFGQDARHFFPGCPQDCPQLRDFLIVEGFQEMGEVHDLERDLSDYEPDPTLLEALDRTETSVRPCTVDDEGAITEFLHREFRGRWAYEVTEKLRVDSQHHNLFALVGESGPLLGLALAQTEGGSMLMGGAVWRLSLGPNWGALGPVGVARAVRGAGLGHALIAGSLVELKHRGVRRCIIDSTVMPRLYERHGFSISRTYTRFELSLEEGC